MNRYRSGESGSSTFLKESIWPLTKTVILPAAIAISTALAVGNCMKNACCNKSDGAAETSTAFVPMRHIKMPDLKPRQIPLTVWDNDPEYNRVVPGGEFSATEYAKRTFKMPDGTEFFKDIGSLYFYKVQEDDDFDIIKNRLLGYKNFAYLKDADDYKLKSFNLPKKSLKPGMWIPAPQPEENRIISDEQFINYCNQAIDQIVADPNYSRSILKIIAKSGRSELLAVMTAVAKQESGGKPIGQFEFHRYEPSHGAFSFSLFHVLMKDVGLGARRKLNLTEGQLYHPRNAAKLFLAFLCDKTAAIAASGSGGNGGNPVPGTAPGAEKYFPLMEHLEDFAAFYNGRNWRKTNPNYCENITRYHNQSLSLLEGQPEGR